MKVSRTLLEKAAAERSLTLLGIVDLDCSEAHARYEDWIERGLQAQMRFMEQHAEIRRHAGRVLAGARTAVVLGLPYFMGDRFNDEISPRVAQYARFKDYHRLLKERAEAVADLFWSDRRESFRVTVDSAPVFERALASRGSLGFIGKNTCYIHPRQGSFFLLGEILTTEALDIDEKVAVDPERHTPEGGCGKCNRCQVACPTGALSRDYVLDANRCLAYWTIEHRGTIPTEFWPALRYYVFGCDICQLVCPYNKKTEERVYLPADIRQRELPDLFEMATMSQIDYERWFGGTPLTRAKRGGLRRNALIALTVTGDPRLAEAIRRVRTDLEFPLPETLVQIESFQAV